jgi:hypothetical protein
MYYIKDPCFFNKLPTFLSLFVENNIHLIKTRWSFLRSILYY